MRRLSATSYAVLGLLAVRPRSAYDLVGQIKRSNIRLIWPRAESKLYEEPKNLVEHGLAEAGSERAGRARRRTVYRITARGRRALRRWLDEPGAGLLLEFEGLVKVVYGDFGTREQLLANIRRIRDGAVERARLSLPLVQELADVGPRAPERVHVIAVADRFLVDVLQATLRWSEWAEQVVAQWPGTALDPRMAAASRTLLRENATTVEAIASRARRDTPEVASRTHARRAR
jgi:PadR family transcriptional regulator, regulatory protein AphA